MKNRSSRWKVPVMLCAEKEIPMNTPALSIRAITAVMAVALIAGLNTQALATISSPVTDQKTLVATDVAAPIADIRIEASSKSKEPLIRVAPSCPTCRYFEGG
jgi:hypothetical protein